MSTSPHNQVSTSMAYGFTVPREKFNLVTFTNVVKNSHATKNINICFKVHGDVENPENKLVFLYWQSCFEPSGIPQKDLKHWDGTHVVTTKMSSDWMKEIETSYDEEQVAQVCRHYNIPIQTPRWDILLTKMNWWEIAANSGQSSARFGRSHDGNVTASFTLKEIAELVRNVNVKRRDGRM